MSIFSDNIRFLRGKKEKTQQELADSLAITRSRYVAYEDGRSEPPIELIVKISKLFHVSIDLLVSVDIRKYPVEEILKLPDNRIVLPVIVDHSGNNVIEIVSQKASMGYLEGYSDVGYIENLQRVTLPFLANGKYRAFPADGDSMPPFKNGSYIVGKYVEQIDDLKPGKTYVFITLNNGITYKRFAGRSGNKISVTADNVFYEPYDIPVEEIVEVWQYASGIFPADFEPDHSEQADIKEMFFELKKDIRELEDKVSGKSK
ncbi:XRE family transcriptional regulator [Chryseobacterium lactis]|uniref:LexA family transcriptional regulator n=1 Tax=Chryseobacterium lactis TaxID=1241981 RepID=A0A3G6RGD6_CHRLC|nr:LexA family transcriptional regulator [Chryseobacterium lactis]AZA83727.1 LexA family transcriptional regulator [Chryseobacterium lactis]AZB04112.1 LexA family transcriptional regulator [Chryseobacterium lactis]PNW12980.1 XRE family transcriptional regulator [Chryseobacterium lactis]